MAITLLFEEIAPHCITEWGAFETMAVILRKTFVGAADACKTAFPGRDTMEISPPLA